MHSIHSCSVESLVSGTAGSKLAAGTESLSVLGLVPPDADLATQEARR